MVRNYGSNADSPTWLFPPLIGATGELLHFDIFTHILRTGPCLPQNVIMPLILDFTKFLRQALFICVPSNNWD